MSRKRTIAVLFFGVFLSVLLTGCLFSSKEVTVCRADKDEQVQYYRNVYFNQDGMIIDTENFLRSYMLYEEGKNDPSRVLAKLDEFFQLSQDVNCLMMAADFCHATAVKTSGEEALKCHLAAYGYWMKIYQLHLTRKQNFIDSYNEAAFYVLRYIQVHNDCCEALFKYLKERNLLDADSISFFGLNGQKFTIEKPVYNLSLPRESYLDFSLCSEFLIKGLEQKNRRGGIGIQLVAQISPKKIYQSLKLPDGMSCPVTVMLEPMVNDPHDFHLRFKYHDTLRNETIRDFGCIELRQAVPLALDFTTPLAYMLNKQQDRNLLELMLHPFRYEDENLNGLFAYEPYQPDKIPVIFIHGLMSSPETWTQMFNALRVNPKIRKNYQFWFFKYPSGSSVFMTANQLHSALLAAQKEFCTTPESTANFEKMVIIGHSMGGLLARANIQKEPAYLAEHCFGFSMEEIKAKLQPDDYLLLQKYCLYEPLPFVHRIIFMAVPHKGAKMAQSTIAQLGIKLTQHSPQYMKNIREFKRLYRQLNPLSFNEIIGELKFTGIENLNPDAPAVRAMGSSPMKDDLTYHSIIGNKEGANIPGGSDGVVPYNSSHLNGAASELIVKSGHSVHRTPTAIKEVLRILLLHLKQNHITAVPEK